MSLESQIASALAGLRSRPARRASQLRKGIAAEMEHKRTVRWAQKHPKATARQVAARIARDHLREDPHYYDKLEAVEGKIKRQPGLKPPRIKLLGRRGPVRIHLVDTTAAKRIYADWTEGGHDRVYDFVPRNEVWLANNLPPLELRLTMLHELRERRRMGELMRGGMSRSDAYDKAHDESLVVEDHYRKVQGRGLDAALRKERGR